MGRIRTFSALIFAASAASFVLPVSGQWSQVLTAVWPATPKVFALAALGDRVFAGFESGLFYTSDRGGHWEHVEFGSNGRNPVFSLATDSSVLYAGTVEEGVYKSIDSGVSWTPAGLSHGYITTIAAIEGRLFAGTCCNGLKVSSDGGTSWRNAGIDTGYIYSVRAVGGTVFVSAGIGYYRSSDGGDNWERIHIGPGAADSVDTDIATLGGEIYAGTRGGLYRSSDGGSHWTRTGFTGGVIYAMATYREGLFVCDLYGLFHTSDGGDSWLRVDSGQVPPRPPACLVVSGDDLFAGVSSNGIWRRTLADMVPTALGEQGADPAGRHSAGRGSEGAPRFEGGTWTGFGLAIPGTDPELRDARGRRSRVWPGRN